MLRAALLLGGLCLVTGTVFKLQFDDTHHLIVNGRQISTGSSWSRVYTAHFSGAIQSIAVYAENTYGGPKGIMLTQDGRPVDYRRWKCQTVSCRGSADSTYKDWFKPGYNDAGWRNAVKINGPRKSFSGGDWWWAATGGNRCICRINVHCPCSPNPCRNGGRCSANGSSFRCSCVNGYYGTRCESHPCKPNRCLNGGRCVPNGSSYRCVCVNGYTGSRCERNPCKPNPCLNGGRCACAGSSYRCTCVNGYTGSRCQSHPCQPNPCLNGGRCAVSGSSYRCSCVNGYFGSRCERNPCRPNPCQNGGRCICRGTSYSCSCVNGYTGNQCQTRPCQNVQLQFDDSHQLYINGVLKSTGNRWNRVYTIHNTARIHTLAFYAENTYGGPQGIAITVGGKAIPLSQWRCQTLTCKTQLTSTYRGYYAINYNDSRWGRAKYINGPTKYIKGANWTWSTGGGSKCICRIRFH